MYVFIYLFTIEIMSLHYYKYTVYYKYTEKFGNVAVI